MAVYDSPMHARVANSGGGPTSIDLSSGATETDTNGVIGAGSSWGVDSNVAVDETKTANGMAVFGYRTIAMPAFPANMRFLRVIITCLTPPTVNANSAGRMGVGVVIKNTSGAPAAGADGFYCGLHLDSGNNLELTSGRSLSSSMSGTTGITGTGRNELILAYDAPNTRFGSLVWSGAGGSAGSDGEVSNAGISNSFAGGAHLGVLVYQTDSTPIAGPSTATWGGVKIQYEAIVGAPP